MPSVHDGGVLLPWPAVVMLKVFLGRWIATVKIST